MPNSDYDFLSYATTNHTAPVSAMGEVMQYVQAMSDLDAAIESTKASLLSLEAERRRLGQDVIPSVMAQNGLAEVKLSNGKTVSVSTELSCKLPEDPVKRQIALAWLREHGGSSKIQEQLIVEDSSEELVQVLMDLGASFSKKEGIHPMSLKAWIRDYLGLRENAIAQGEMTDLPPELGVYVYQTTKIKG